jgi:CRISPR-associated protein Cas1
MPKHLSEASDLIPGRMLNQYVYCPRLAYLEWVQKDWHDNWETLHGQYVHRRVDEPSGDLPESDEIREGLQARSVMLSSEALGVIVRMDVIEAADGAVSPVDFKRGTTPTWQDTPFHPDAVQVAAQALVLRDNGYRVTTGYLYYHGSRERVEVPLTDGLIAYTIKTIESLRAAAANNVPPPPLVDSPKCPRCSLVGICLPDEVHYLSQSEANDIKEPGARLRRLVPSQDVKVPFYVTTQGVFIGKSGDELVVKDHGQVVQTVRFADISHLAVFGHVQVSTQALHALCERDIPVSYFTWGGSFRGLTHGPSHKNVLLRQAQFTAATDSQIALHIARQLVVGKILNQRTLLRRNARGLPDEVLTQLKGYADKAQRAHQLDELLGIEGMAARTYFSHFEYMLKNVGTQFTWEQRNRRPPRDPVNALLSLGYSLLAAQLTSLLTAIGFDPYLGYLHQPKYGKPALALDLMEEFRPLVVDSTVIRCLNTGELTRDDFLILGVECALKDKGRRKFIAALERRLNSEIVHPVFRYQISYRRTLEVQARLLGRFLTKEIPEYPVFRTR